MTDSKRGDGRDNRGRFAPGNPGGPGNPNVRRIGEYREALARALSAEDLGRIIDSLTVSAVGGDTDAAVALLDRTLGKPRPEDRRILTPIELAPIDDPDAVVAALDRVARAVASGTITVEEGEAVRKAIGDVGEALEAREWVAMRERLEALEVPR